MRALIAVGIVLLTACSPAASTETTLGLDAERFELLDPVLLDDDAVAAVLDGSNPPPVYNSDPPTSGTRSAEIAQCGIYRTSIPDIYQVASLAQGAVMVQYRADFTADARDAVERAVRGIGDGVIAAPRPQLDAPIVLTAWGVKMTLPFSDPERIAAFVDQFGGAGPDPRECPFTVDDT